jgi:endonuclease-3
MRVVPAEFLHDAHHWLILHGRYVCKARKPDCPHCPIVDLCEYRHKTPAAAESAGDRAGAGAGRRRATRTSRAAATRRR